MFKWALAPLMLLAVPSCVAQVHKILADAGTVVCDSSEQGAHIGKKVHSSSGYSASADISMKISGSNDHRHCITTWRLHVSDHGPKERVITISQRDDTPSDNEWVQENSFEINTWSEDGKMLLASQIQAQGDWDETTPIVFDFTSGRFWRIDLAPLFTPFIPANCYVVYSVAGFTKSGRVIIAPISTDGEREAGTPPCFATDHWWLDFRRNSIGRISAR